MRRSVRAKPPTVASGVRRSWHASDTNRANESSKSRILGTVGHGRPTGRFHTRPPGLGARGSARPVARGRLGVTRRSGSATAAREKLDRGRDRLHGRPRPGAEGRPHVALPGALRGGDRGGRDRRGAPRRGRWPSTSPRTSSSGRCAARRGADRRALPARAKDARSPASPTQEMVAPDRHRRGVGRAASRRLVGVEATGINACPCAQGLVRGRAWSACSKRASTRATSSGSSSSSRSRRTTSAAAGRSTSARRRASTRSSSSTIVERSMSAPVYELLKRPDELFVVEHAHLQPRFVEDSVRLALQGVLERVPGARRRRLRLLAPGQPRDDPHPRRARRALRHGRRAARASSIGRARSRATPSCATGSRSGPRASFAAS